MKNDPQKAIFESRTTGGSRRRAALRITFLSVALVVPGFFLPRCQVALAQGTSFTYQGRLNSGGNAANGSYDLTFTLFATNTGGVSVAGPVTNSATAVSSGLFTVTIDFGPGVFTGGSNWLEIAVRTNGSGSFTLLTPRQQLTPTPYAITAENATMLTSGAAIGAGAGNSISSNGAEGSFIGGGLYNDIQFNSLYSFIGGGVGNTNFANAGLSVIGGGQGNQSASGWSVIGGGNGNQIGANSAQATIAGGAVNVIGMNNTEAAIAGGAANTIQSGSYYSFIGGGVSNTNFSNAGYSVIGGGQGNQSASGWSVLAGGYGNVIGGGSIVNATISGGSQNTNNASFATVGGGQFNLIPNTGIWSFIGSGYQNLARGGGATVGGGAGNTAGDYAVVGGGQENTASGNSAFVGGGILNTARGQYSTVGGGQQNLAGTNYSTVAGGIANSARGWSAFVGGGGFDGTTYGANTAGGNASVVGGGLANVASGSWATVPGGSADVAAGAFSFAAGQQAQALHQGAFVWADSSNAVFASTAADQFNVRADGGVRFVTGGAGMTLDGQPVITSFGVGNNGNVYFGPAGNSAPGTIGYNTGIGFGALTNNTTGFYNTANGAEALNNNTDGWNNTASGTFALESNTDGSWNTANGMYALYTNTIGNYNTAVGFAALVNNTVGSYNIALGYQAGFYITTGSSNIDIGNGGLSTDTNIIRIGTGQSQTFIAGVITGNGSGLTNLSTTSVIADARGDFLLGGLGNTISGCSNAVVAGGSHNAIQASGSYGFIGGGSQNTTTGEYATLCGGSQNISSGTWAMVGGGDDNTASGDYSTVGGGVQNTAAGLGATVGGGGFDGIIFTANSASGNGSVVGGGMGNIASRTTATVAGGALNTSSGGDSTVGGGALNTASGNSATVPGGYRNTASGSSSFAAGQQAQALHPGAFVWADSQNVVFASSGNDQFLLRAQGGVGINTTNPSGAALSVNGGALRLNDNPIYLRGGADAFHGLGWYSSGTFAGANPDGPVLFGCGGGALGVGCGTPSLSLLWTATGVTVNGTFNNNSDRNAKEDFADISSQLVLDRVLTLPISEWSYKTDTATRHIGPMAQDFYSAFGVGTDDRHIAPIDEGGVALAAIQGLNRKVEALEHDLATRAAENSALQRRLDVRDAEFQALQQSVGELRELLARSSQPGSRATHLVSDALEATASP